MMFQPGANNVNLPISSFPRYAARALTTIPCAIARPVIAPLPPIFRRQDTMIEC